jgi:hypothetical protein
MLPYIYLSRFRQACIRKEEYQNLTVFAPDCFVHETSFFCLIASVLGHVIVTHEPSAIEAYEKILDLLKKERHYGSLAIDNVELEKGGSL